ncbi:hypothetical protein D3C73_1385680 [compost metagenome]
MGKSDVRVLMRERVQLKQRRPRQERPVHMVERVLRRRADEDDRPLLHRREQGILPRRVEAVHLVEKQDRLAPIHRFG